MMRTWIGTVAAAGVAAWLAGGAAAAIKTEAVDYTADGKTMQGYFAYDDAIQGKRPAILVIHEWTGHGPYVRRRAEQLAALGYLAFAGDIYGKGVVAKDHAEAAKLSGMYREDRDLLRARAAAALARMKAHPLADPARCAAIGYCFGGCAALEMVRAGMDVRGVVTFHGALDAKTPAAKGVSQAKVLVCQGGADAFTLKAVPALEDELTAAGIDWQVNVYAGAVHSFTVKEAGDDPAKGMAYNESADRRSWQAMRDFFDEVLK